MAKPAERRFRRAGSVRVSGRRAEAKNVTKRTPRVYTSITQTTPATSARVLSLHEVRNRTARHWRLRSQHMRSTLSARAHGAASRRSVAVHEMGRAAPICAMLQRPNHKIHTKPLSASLEAPNRSSSCAAEFVAWLSSWCPRRAHEPGDSSRSAGDRSGCRTRPALAPRAGRRPKSEGLASEEIHR